MIKLAILKDPLISDFNLDGKNDIFYQDDQNYMGVWHMDGAGLIEAAGTEPFNSGSFGRVFGCGDFNHDGKVDLAFQASSGSLFIWTMNDAIRTGTNSINSSTPPDSNWHAVALGDLNRDGHLDVFFQSTDGSLHVWYLDASHNPTAVGDVFYNPTYFWKVVGLGDFNQDGKLDILFQHDDSSLVVWFMDDITYINSSYLNPSSTGDVNWRAKSVNDQNGDGLPDVLFQYETTTMVAVWFMNGVNWDSPSLLNPEYSGGTWRIAAP